VWGLPQQCARMRERVGCRAKVGRDHGQIGGLPPTAQRIRCRFFPLASLRQGEAAGSMRSSKLMKNMPASASGSDLTAAGRRHCKQADACLVVKQRSRRCEDVVLPSRRASLAVSPCAAPIVVNPVPHRQPTIGGRRAVCSPVTGSARKAVDGLAIRQAQRNRASHSGRRYRFSSMLSVGRLCGAGRTRGAGAWSASRSAVAAQFGNTQTCLTNKRR
jgi:hypothetical protein